MLLPYLEQAPVYNAQNGTLPVNWTTSLEMFCCPLRNRPGYIIGNTGSASGFLQNGSVIPAGATVTIDPATLDTGTATGPGGALVEWDFSNSGGWVGWDGNTIGNWSWQFGAGTIGFVFTNTSGVALTVSGFSGTATDSGGVVNGSGPSSDYGINPYLNSSAGTLNAPNSNTTLTDILDGTSNTILMGHIYYAVPEYVITLALRGRWHLAG
jgi:hypothetical protein